MLLPYKVNFASSTECRRIGASVSICCLLNGTGDGGEYGIGAGADELNGSYDNNQNHRQHDCIFRDILCFLFAPKSAYKLHMYTSFLLFEIEWSTPVRTETGTAQDLPTLLRVIIPCKMTERS